MTHISAFQEFALSVLSELVKSILVDTSPSTTSSFVSSITLLVLGVTPSHPRDQSFMRIFVRLAHYAAFSIPRSIPQDPDPFPVFPPGPTWQAIVSHWKGWVLLLLVTVRQEKWFYLFHFVYLFILFFWFLEGQMPPSSVMKFCFWKLFSFQARNRHKVTRKMSEKSTLSILHVPGNRYIDPELWPGNQTAYALGEQFGRAVTVHLDLLQVHPLNWKK